MSPRSYTNVNNPSNQDYDFKYFLNNVVNCKYIVYSLRFIQNNCI